MNTYAYVDANPLVYIDALGLLQGPFGPNCGPEGTDLATWIPDGAATNACINHDACYSGSGAYSGHSRQQCDSDFLRDMLHDNVNPIDAYIYYRAVSSGGQKHFDNARKKNKVPPTPKPKNSVPPSNWSSPPATPDDLKKKFCQQNPGACPPPPDNKDC